MAQAFTRLNVNRHLVKRRLCKLRGVLRLYNVYRRNIVEKGTLEKWRRNIGGTEIVYRERSYPERTISIKFGAACLNRVVGRRAALGFKVIERTVGDSHIGFRVSYLEKVLGPIVLSRKKVPFGRLRVNRVKYCILARALQQLLLKRLSSGIAALSNYGLYTRFRLEKLSVADKLCSNNRLFCQRHTFVTWKQATKPKRSLTAKPCLNTVHQLYLKNLLKGFYQITSASTENALKTQHQLHLSKLNNFAKAFLSLNIIYNSFKKQLLLTYKAAFKQWTRPSNLKGGLQLQVALTRVLHRVYKRVFHRPQPFLLHVLRKHSL